MVFLDKFIKVPSKFCSDLEINQKKIDELSIW